MPPPKNRAERLYAILKRHPKGITLGQLIVLTLRDGGLIYKLTAAISELRKTLELNTPSRTIHWQRGETPSKGLYKIVYFNTH